VGVKVMTTGDKIKDLRIKKGLTQEELGQKLGVQKSAVHKWENGLVVNLKRSIIAKLAMILECSPTYLFDDEIIKPADDIDGELKKLLKDPELKAIYEILIKLSPDALKLARAHLDLLLKAQANEDRRNK
jgi:transcriptional regulator with XRE-family HTH domain